ncbi:MAG: hypothetical protein ACR2LN_04295 [Candidatus Levyibacteriota bacterium]
MAREREGDTAVLEQETDQGPSPEQMLLALYDAPWEDQVKAKDTMEAYLLERGEPLVKRKSATALPTEKFGGWTQVLYRDRREPKNHTVMVYGDLNNGALGNREGVLVRVHSSHEPNEIWGAPTSDDRQQLIASMKEIHKRGGGVIIYVKEDGRGLGEEAQHLQFQNMFEWENHDVVHKINPETGKPITTSEAYKKAGVPHEARRYNHIGDIIRDLKLKSITLMSNSPHKRKGLEEARVKVIGTHSLHIPADNPTTIRYQQDQRKNGYHLPPQATVFAAR